MSYKDGVESQNEGMYGQGRDDSEQLEDASNEVRLGAIIKDDRSVSYGLSWLAPTVLVWIPYASEGSIPQEERATALQQCFSEGRQE